MEEAVHHRVQRPEQAWHRSRAETLQRMALEASRRVRGEDHPHTLSSMHSLANAIKMQDRHSEAEPLFRESIDIVLKTMPRKATDIAIFRVNYGADGAAPSNVQAVCTVSSGGRQSLAASSHPAPTKRRPPFRRRQSDALHSGVDGATPSIVDPGYCGDAIFI